MDVTKRNGTREPVNVNKIIDSLSRTCEGLNVDVTKIATKTIGGLFDGATTRQVDELSIDKAVWMIEEDPDYSKAAARTLSNVIAKDVAAQEIQSFSQSVAVGFKNGLFSAELQAFVKKNARKLNAAVVRDRDNRFDYFGIKIVYDRYLARHPESRAVIETPQYWLMRVACGILMNREGIDINSVINYYDLISLGYYLNSTPTLFNAGTVHSQMSSCYLCHSPEDSLVGIYGKYQDVALLSKFAGGIGLDYTLVRAAGCLIKGTNGESNGIIPFIHTQDSSVIAIDQGGKRKGAAAIYLESWHADVYDFLNLRKNTGDAKKRAHNLNLSNWVPDLLMERNEEGAQWSLFSPNIPEVKALTEMYDDEFRVAYIALETKYEAMDVKPKWYKRVDARDLFGKMMNTLIETGNGWMCFKDISNRTANQVSAHQSHLEQKRIIHLSNLCTEILQVVSNDETAVCNLGSIILSAFVKPDRTIDYPKLAQVVRTAMIGLDSVIDKNFYPIPSAQYSNSMWRPVGLGIMATHDMFHLMGLSFDDPEALQLVTDVQAFIYYHALDTSVDMAIQLGRFPNFGQTRLAQDGKFQFELWKTDTSPPTTVNGLLNWEQLRQRITEFGMRNSLSIAIAPTASVASISGVRESIEPSVSNIYSRQTLSGDFMQVDTHLVRELQKLGLWSVAMAKRIIAEDGSIQNIEEIPASIKRRFRTAWEYSMKTLIDLAAGRGRYIDQSQSLNLYLENATIGKASSMYMYLWKKGIKTSYYLRSRAASKIAKVTTGIEVKQYFSDAEAIACSLENPELCEACQ